MINANILSVAYQRKDAGDNRSLGTIISEIKTDLAEMMPPAPGPTDECGQKSVVINGVRKRYKLMGDGSMVEIEQ